MRLALPILLLPLLAPVALAQAGPQGTIILTSGDKKQGEVLEELADGIRIKVGGKEEKVARAQISRVDYGGARPGALSTGDRFMNNGEPGKAAQEYSKGASSVPPLFKPHCLYHAGRALVRANKFEEAAGKFKECLEVAPKGWFLPDATREGVRAWIRAGQASKGVAMADDALKLFGPAGVAPDAANLAKAEALEADGKRKEAVAVYVELAKSRDPQIQALADLGRGRGALADGSASEATDRFKKVLNGKDVSRAARAGAARGLADVLMMPASVKTDVKALRAAATAYAEAASIYFPGPDDPQTDRQGALTGLATCYEALAALAASNKTGQERYLEMAKAIREEIAALYPAAARGAAPTDKED